MTTALATDLASSLLGSVGCFAVVWWVLRTPGRSFLEQRSVWLLGIFGLVYLLRLYGWLYDEASFARWLAFWPVTLEPIVMVLFVEGLVRRHVPIFLKWIAVGWTAFFVIVQLLPSPPRVDLLTLWWPVGMAMVLALCAWQMWRMRDAGLSREERRMLAGVTAVAVVSIPLVFSDGRVFQPFVPVRMGAIGGLLLARVLLTPPATDGLRDTLVGIVRVAWRGVIVAVVMTAALLGVTKEHFIEAFTLAVSLLLLFEVLDRLRRRERSEVEASLLHWLVSAPREGFAEWRRALKHAPLMGDAIIFDETALARYDPALLRTAFAQHGTLLAESEVRALAAADAGTGDAMDQVLDLLTTHDLTHVGLLSAEPLVLIGANVPQVATPDGTLRLHAILRTGQDVLHREVARA